MIYETPNHFGRSMLKSLPVYQTITWYDSVSSFSGIEKKTTLTTLKNNLDDLMEILQFGDSPWKQPSSLFVFCMTINWYKWFEVCAFFQEKFFIWKMLPTLDALTLHLRRVAYQCYIWRMPGRESFGSPISCWKWLGYYWRWSQTRIYHFGRSSK